jgi:hypothetical protein
MNRSNSSDYLADGGKFVTNGWSSTEASMGQPVLLLGLISFLGLVAFIVVLFTKNYIWRVCLPILILAGIRVTLLPLIICHVEARYLIPPEL